MEICLFAKPEIEFFCCDRRNIACSYNPRAMLACVEIDDLISSNVQILRSMSLS